MEATEELTLGSKVHARSHEHGLPRPLYGPGSGDGSVSFHHQEHHDLLW